MTNSVDAAMANIPDGWRLSLRQDDWPEAPGKWGCELYGPMSYEIAPANPHFADHYAKGNGATAAEAIENAILRAQRRQEPR